MIDKKDSIQVVDPVAEAPCQQAIGLNLS